jgi:hypothetical protein
MKLRREYRIVPIHLNNGDSVKITVTEEGTGRLAAIEPVDRSVMIDCVRTYDVEPGELGFADGIAVLAGEAKDAPTPPPPPPPPPVERVTLIRWPWRVF